MLDMTFGISYSIKEKHSLTSKKFLSGLIHNFVPAFFPAVIYLMNKWSNTHSPIYSYASLFIFLCVFYFTLQSFLTNLKLLGLELPPFINSWIKNEFNRKKEDQK